VITLDTLVMTIPGLERCDVEHLVAWDCIRPAGRQGAWLFREIDIARLRLIQELRRDLDLPEDALPIVLHLLDQLYATRRRLRRLHDAVEQAAPPDVRQAVIEALLVATARDTAPGRS
jgi:chaperone modulatory protein CbpM